MVNSFIPFRKEKFLQEVISLSEKYNVCLSHEDYHGGFLIEDCNNLTEKQTQRLKDWLLDAEWAN